MQSFFARKTSPNSGMWPRVRPSGTGWDCHRKRFCKKSATFEKALTLLPDVPAIHGAWKRIVAAHKVQGVKVYDARLAAIMSVYSVESVLTFNSVDFERFTNVHAIHPASLVP